MSVEPEPIDRLGTVLQAVADQLPNGVNALIGGINEVARASSENRVVFEPATRQLNPPNINGSLATRVETVRLHIWGATLPEVEELEERLLNTLVRACTWSFSTGAGAWDLSASGQSGVVAVQEINIHIPIMRRFVEAPLTFEPLTRGFVATLP